jgi:hypothetical protein
MRQKRLEGDVGGRGSHVGKCAGVVAHAGWQDGNQAGGARGHVLAEQRLAADCLQPTLCCGFRQQLKVGVDMTSDVQYFGQF